MAIELSDLAAFKRDRDRDRTVKPRKNKTKTGLGYALAEADKQGGSVKLDTTQGVASVEAPQKAKFNALKEGSEFQPIHNSTRSK